MSYIRYSFEVHISVILYKHLEMCILNHKNLSLYSLSFRGYLDIEFLWPQLSKQSHKKH